MDDKTLIQVIPTGQSGYPQVILKGYFNKRRVEPLLGEDFEAFDYTNFVVVEPKSFKDKWPTLGLAYIREIKDEG